MYAVVYDGDLIYSGDDLIAALNSFSSKVGTSLHNIESLLPENLASIGVKYKPNINSMLNHKIESGKPVEGATRVLLKELANGWKPNDLNIGHLKEELSEAAKNLIDKLDRLEKWDVSEITGKSEEILAEVRHIGIKGMKTIGDGFIAIGDVLRKSLK